MSIYTTAKGDERWTQERVEEAWDFQLLKLGGEKLAVVLEEMPLRQEGGKTGLWIPRNYVMDPKGGIGVPARVTMVGAGRWTLHGQRVEVTDYAVWDRVLVWGNDFASYGSNPRAGIVNVTAVIGKIAEDERSLAHLAELKGEADG